MSGSDFISAPPSSLEIHDRPLENVRPYYHEIKDGGNTGTAPEFCCRRMDPAPPEFPGAGSKVRASTKIFKKKS
jgi:hypothetical protein